MRQRDKAFADAFMDELRSKDLRSAMLAAGKRMGWEKVKKNGFPMPYNDRRILARSRRVLARDGTMAYLRDMFEAVGFSPLDATRMMVDHIQGNLTTEKLTKDGEIREVKIPPSLEALKAYNKMTLEDQPHKVQVDTRMLVAHRVVGDAPPITRARVLGPAKSES